MSVCIAERDWKGATNDMRHQTDSKNILVAFVDMITGL